MFNNILIPTDGSELSQRAVQTAIALAKLHRARLVGIHVIPDYHLLIAYEGAFDPITEERIEEEAKTRAESYLAFIRRSAQEAGVPCDTLCETSDHPYDANLFNAAQTRGPDAQAHPAVRSLDPETPVMEVGLQSARGLVLGVRDVVALHRLLAGDLADTGHRVLLRRLA